ncbi:RNA-binding protein 14 [Bombina bombina]|uniref:RNA-binding protein 14 n=1 Tax=Bombina bombina TaxID=8345 RepID=UPI00235A6693|nr:RNA-binding protein 14 [Bombina bombina]
MKIFIGNLDDRANQEELTKLFEQHGTVVSCAVMKQYAFVHMRDEERATRAVRELNGHMLHGKKMVVELSKPRPNNTWKIFIGNVSSACHVAELRGMFEMYGRVVECDIVKDFAFVHMERESDAREAIEHLNGKEIKGKHINVELSNKMQRYTGGGSQDRPRRHYDYKEPPRERADVHHHRRAADASFASSAMSSPYERNALDAPSYSYESRPRQPSPLYYTRDRSPMRRRSPSKAAYAASHASTVYGSRAALDSAYEDKAAAALASAYERQASSLISAYAAAYGNGSSSYEAQRSGYGTGAGDSYSRQAAGSYGMQGSSSLDYGSQVSALDSSYGTQTSTTPYMTEASVTSPYRLQSSAFGASQQVPYSSLSTMKTKSPMYERTRLSPPRSSASDSYKKPTDSLTSRLASDRRYSELSDYRRLTESQAAYRRSPPKLPMDYRRTPENDLSHYAPYSDYLRSAQLKSSYQRHL